MVSRNSNPFWTEDTVAAAVLASAGTGLFQNRLDTIVGALNYPMLETLVQCWPVLLILSGLVLLVMKRSSEKSSLQVVPSRNGEVTHDNRM